MFLVEVLLGGSTDQLVNWSTRILSRIIDQATLTDDCPAVLCVECVQ